MTEGRQDIIKGLWKENPVFVQMLGLCPSLAVTTKVEYGLGMGLATLFVLVSSNIVVSLVRKIIPKQVRIPAFIVIIATFVTIVDLVLKGYAFDLHKSLGLFIPLIVVNCIILGRAEAFASKHSVGGALLDGLGMGIGFTLALAMLGAVREIFGNGSLLGYRLFPSGYEPVIVMILPPGAFITLGFLLAFFRVAASGKKSKEDGQ